MADVKTPFGSIPKPMVYVAVLAGGGAIIYAYVKKKNAANKAAQTAAAQTTASAYQTNPNQYAYGAYGYGAYTYEPYGYGYGPEGLGAYGGSGNYGYGYYGAGSPTEQVPTQATTNAQWSQAAVSALTQGGNYTSTQVLAALGLYLTGGALSSDQVSIVQSAIAAEGYPPIPGNNGYPPALNQGGTTSGGTPSNNGNVTVPNVTGENYGKAYNDIVYGAKLKIAVKGKATAAGTNTSWMVTAQNPSAGANVSPGSTVTVTVTKQ